MKTRLKEKLVKLEEEVKRLAAIEKALLASPDKQISSFGRLIVSHEINRYSPPPLESRIDDAGQPDKIDRCFPR